MSLNDKQRSVDSDLVFNKSGEVIPGRRKARGFTLQMSAGYGELDFKDSGLKFDSVDDFIARIEAVEGDQEHSYVVKKLGTNKIAVENKTASCNNLLYIGITELPK